MLKSLKKYNIPFEGLKEGYHQYEFEVDNTFFSAFENAFISNGKFNVKVGLTKQSTMLLLDFDIAGVINTLCDRCSEELEVPIKTVNEIIVKFGNEEAQSEEIVMLPIGAYEINVAQLIYELISVQYPQRNIHQEGKCNQATIRRLEALEIKENKAIDPRWEKLQNIK